jgi:hypothetical protein
MIAVNRPAWFSVIGTTRPPGEGAVPGVSVLFIATLRGPGGWLGDVSGLWLGIAVVGWILAIVLGVLLLAGLRRRLSRSPGRLQGAEEGNEPTLLPRPADAGVVGVLRWLLEGTDAEGVACLEMRPKRGERLRIEPRGLPDRVVATLARRGRDALLGSGPQEPSGVVSLRWLGAGGPRALVALGTASDDAREALRFGRYLIEWVVASRSEDQVPELERRLGDIPGVAWAEIDHGEGRARLLLSEGADAPTTEAEVRRALEPAELHPSWIEVPASVPSEPAETGPSDRVGAREVAEPRVKLVEVAFSQDGQATADVRVMWKDHELRGRGHARATPAGPYYAGAKALADALRPLLDSEVVVEGLYQASTDQAVPVLIAEVLFEGEHLVGAVVDRSGEAHWAGARAVLDAVNRRLVQVAGRSGRL